MDQQQQLFRGLLSFLLRLIIVISILVPTQNVSAAPTNWYVTTAGNDTNSCTTTASPCLTINGAIGKAIDGDTIYVAAGTYTSSGAEVVLIYKNLTLSGGWDITFTMQSGASIIDGQGARRGILVSQVTSTTLDNFTVQNGFHDMVGGGIRNYASTLTIDNSIIKNNVSQWMGGGISNYGTLTINNTIISDNSAGQVGWSGGGGGGGIMNHSGVVTLNNTTVSNNTILGAFDGSAICNFGVFTLNNSTISDNTNQPSIYSQTWYMTLNNTTVSNNTSGGIYIIERTLTLNNSTISNNLYGISASILSTVTLTNSIVANNTNYDCVGPITSVGYNLIGNSSGCTFSATTGDLVGTSLAPINPKLGTLQNNGGSTYTQALLWGSPAIDAGNPASPSNAGDACLLTDQRGVTRPIDDNVVVGAVCDIGAYEFNDNTPQVVILPRMYTVNEQATLLLHGTGISVGDINNDPLTVTITASNANSQIFADTGSVNVVSGNGTSTLVLTGTVAQLNDFFAGNFNSTLTYRLNDDTPVASVTLTITADDGSSTGSDTATIKITAVNDAPVNTVPGTQTVNEDTALVFSGGNSNQISVNDVDVGTDSLEVTLSVTNGTLTLAGTTGLSFTIGDGTADSSMVFQGVLTDINSALATLTFNPTANYYGSAVLALTTNDFGNTGIGGALTDSDTVNITVNNVNDPPTVANPIPDQNATEDSAFNFQFAANTFSDIDTGNTLTYSAQLAGGGTLPAWLSFNAATRTFSGTPANGDVSTISIDVIADDGNGGTVTDTFNIIVANTNDPPVIANPIPDQNATEDSAFNFTFSVKTFNDPDVNDTLTYTAQLTGGGALPAWLSFNAATRTFSGTPTNGDVGTISIDVTADDGNGGTVTDTFNIIVANSNDNPTVANPIPDQNATEDSAFNFQFAANTFSDPDVGDTLTYSAQSAGGGALPAWLSFDAVTRTFSGTPANGDVGTVSIDAIANDGNGGTVTDTFNIIVANTNDAPIVANPIPNQSATESQAFNYQFPSNTFTDPDVGDTLTYSAQLSGGGALPAWLSFDAATRTFSGTPSNGDIGIVSIDVIADDGNGGTVTDTFDIVVMNVNNAPTVANPIPNQNATEDAIFNFQFAANTFSDPDVGDTLTYSAQLTGGGALPAWLSFDVVTRTFSGIPTNSDVGTVAIDVIANDSNGGTVTDTFNIVVANTNDAPTVANPIPDQNTIASQTFNYQFPANTFNDIDVGDTLAYSAQLAGGGALPAWLSFDPNTRTFSGTPTNGDVGTVAIDVIADDGNGGTITDTFNITVTNDNVAPTLTINQAVTQTDPTETSPILFTVIFSEPINISTFTNADIIFAGTATGTLSVVVTEIAPNDGTTFEVAVSSMTASGTVIASIGAGAVQDSTGNNNTASTSTDNLVTYSPIYPTVASTSLKSSYTNLGPNTFTFTVTFSENVNNPIGSTDREDVTNPANYLLVEDGVNNLFNTTSCSGGLIVDDIQVSVASVAYNATTFTATVTLNTSLPSGNYRLFVCGTTSIVDLALNPLNNGADSIFNFVVMANTASALPSTGFAPNRITSLSPQPANLAYTKMSDLWLEIPSLNLKTNIVGVPKTNGAWNVDWLGNDTGWLNGTAFPTWEGNSVLTGHVYNASGLPGPFANLKNLKYGDHIIVHLAGQKYIFEVAKTALVRPTDITYAYQHLKDHSYLTLITCQSYDEKTGTYLYRRVVRAILVDVQWDN